MSVAGTGSASLVLEGISRLARQLLAGCLYCKSASFWALDMAEGTGFNFTKILCR